MLALSRAEHHRFAIAAGALFLGAIFLYLVPLVPQAIFDVVIGDESKASTISQRVVAFLGGAATVRESLWRPALILVRPPQADPTESARTLREALHEGVFTVVDDPTGPHGMEHLLRALKRCVDRHFANHWNAA